MDAKGAIKLMHRKDTVATEKIQKSEGERYGIFKEAIIALSNKTRIISDAIVPKNAPIELIIKASQDARSPTCTFVAPITRIIANSAFRSLNIEENEMTSTINDKAYRVAINTFIYKERLSIPDETLFIILFESRG